MLAKLIDFILSLIGLQRTPKAAPPPPAVPASTQAEELGAVAADLKRSNDDFERKQIEDAAAAEAARRTDADVRVARAGGLHDVDPDASGSAAVLTDDGGRRD